MWEGPCASLKLSHRSDTDCTTPISLLKLVRRLTTLMPRPNFIPPTTNLLSCPTLLSSAPSGSRLHSNAHPRAAGMAFVNLVPKLYQSVIEDVMEGVRDLFAEEGIEEQVLKDLKKLWETKVLQSKATEDFFRHSVPAAPLFTVQLPHGLPPTLQSTGSSIVVDPSWQNSPEFYARRPVTPPAVVQTLPFLAIRSTSQQAWPSRRHLCCCFIWVAGHLYKVNVPVMVTQTSGRTEILQHPFQQVLQQLGQPPVIQTTVPTLHPCSLQAATEKSHRMETVLQQPTILHSTPVDRKHIENAASDRRVLPGNELRPQESSQYISLPGVGFPPQVALTESSLEPVLGVSGNLTQNLHGGPFSQGPLHHMLDSQLHSLKDRMYACDSIKQLRKAEEPSSLRVSEKSCTSERDLDIQVTDDDINEIIQIDGSGDNSSTEEVGSIRGADENEFPGVIDAGDLKVLEEEVDSVSNEDSTANSSDEDHQIDALEEDPLNSGDDVSEQDVPDLFDTDNVIVCQYDKIHRSKNRWKFYLKDGVMCFGGRDYVFAKAIGEAEW
ncbi:TFIIA-alpha and beta-like factor [Apodemus speciosus]|uniref:TFIIA-alpha and beta-like factor n=1 Tax=Apodemus speciosus TaxID=105296 RepID=A0ABQ0FQ75_APOSI